MKLAYYSLQLAKSLFDKADPKEKVRIALAFMEHDAAIVLEEMKKKLEDEANANRKPGDSSSGTPQ